MPIVKKETEISSEEIASKIYRSLEKSGWGPILRLFLMDTAFLEIIDTLKLHTKEGRVWLPGIKNMYRFLRECIYSKLKCVIMVNECSTFLDYNTGIPLHLDPITRDGKTFNLKPSRTADNMLWSLGIPRDQRVHSMLPYTAQGVLLLPVNPTCRMEGVAHKKLHDPLMFRIIEAINKKGDIPIILLGNVAEYEPYYTSANIRKIYTRYWSDELWSQWANEKLLDIGMVPVKWK